MKQNLERLEQQRYEDLRQLSNFSKNYFQEWLDLNALGCFQREITPTSSVQRDWANLLNISSQMKFYSPSTVVKMTRIFGIKWGIFMSENREPEAAEPRTPEVFVDRARAPSFGRTDVSAGTTTRRHSNQRLSSTRRDQDLDSPRPGEARNIHEVADLVHESPFVLLLLQSMKDIAVFLERESLRDDERLLNQGTAALRPGDLAPPKLSSSEHRANPHMAATSLVSALRAERGSGDLTEQITRAQSRQLLSPDILHKIQTYLKICALCEVLSYNNLNQILLQKVKAPQFLLQNLVKMLNSLKNYRGSVGELQNCLIISTFKCLSVALRQHSVIVDLLKHREQFVVRIIKLMRSHMTVQPVIQSGLMVLK